MLRRMRRSHLFLLLLALLLANGCATTTETGRSRFVVPKQVSEVYSDVELQAMLAFTPEAKCGDRACEESALFRRQVEQIGQRLEKSVHELGGTAMKFQFLTPSKHEIGTLSNAAGSIVVFDGVRLLELDETALAFVIAREMGHVISEHHEENTSTNIAVSVAATLVMPVATLMRGAAATFSALTSTTALTTAATTAASLASSRIIKSMYRPDQLREADMVALKIMAQAGWTPIEIADALQEVEIRIKDEGWMGELALTKARLDCFTAGPPWLLSSSMAEAHEAVASPLLK
jgi:predicted Zn-dependent protease